MTRRFTNLKKAEGELQVLDRGPALTKLLRKMSLILRRANFIRRSNQLAFAEAVSDFYKAYGEVLRYLKIDEARGKLEPVTTE